MFGGTDGDGVDEGDGGVDKLHASSIGSNAETVPRPSGHLRKAPDC